MEVMIATRAGYWHSISIQQLAIRFDFDYDSIQHWLFWISGTIHGKFSQGKQIS